MNHLYGFQQKKKMLKQFMYMKITALKRQMIIVVKKLLKINWFDAILYQAFFSFLTMDYD